MASLGGGEPALAGLAQSQPGALAPGLPGLPALQNFDAHPERQLSLTAPKPPVYTRRSVIALASPDLNARAAASVLTADVATCAPVAGGLGYYWFMDPV